MRTKVAVFICLVFMGSSLVHADTIRTYSFSGITNNHAADIAIGEAQLRMQVIGNTNYLLDSQVLFKFLNLPGSASSITDVLFDNGTVVGIAQLWDADDMVNGVYGHSGVDFTESNSGNLPGGNDPLVGFDDLFSTDADSAGGFQHNGVNPGEWLGIVVNLKNGKNWNDVIAALGLGSGTGGLRVGLHVQGFAGGGSESFINDTGFLNEVPAPSTLVGLIGVGVVGLFARLRVRRSA